MKITQTNQNNYIHSAHPEKDSLGAFYGMMDFIAKLQLEASHN